MKKISRGIGKRIAKVRKDKGLTQAAFGDIILTSQRYVGMLEKGQRRPSQWLVEYMAREFGVEADWLRCGRSGNAP